MKWRIDFSKDSLKFLEKNNLQEDFVIDKIKLALRKFKGEDRRNWGQLYFARTMKFLNCLDSLYLKHIFRYFSV